MAKTKPPKPGTKDTSNSLLKDPAVQEAIRQEATKLASHHPERPTMNEDATHFLSRLLQVVEDPASPARSLVNMAFDEGALSFIAYRLQFECPFPAIPQDTPKARVAAILREAWMAGWHASRVGLDPNGNHQPKAPDPAREYRDRH